MTSDIQSIYNDLKDYYAYAKVLLGAKNLMFIDFMVSMPRGAFDQRMQDIDVITLKIHDYLSAPFLKEQIQKCEDSIMNNPQDWSVWDRANIREMGDIHKNYAALPQDLYSRYVRIQSTGRRIQKLAQASYKTSQDMDKGLSYLEDVVETMREIAKFKQDAFEADTLYGALTSHRFDDISSRDIETLNNDIKHIYKTTAQIEKPQLLEIQEQPASPLSKRDIMWLSTLLLQQFGFDFQNGRLIVSQSHAFCGGTNLDARILVRCEDPPRFFHTISDVLYQGARGIYMQHIPAEWAHQPVGSLSGMPTVDAYALLLEHFIGSSHAFFAYLEKEIKTLPSAPDDDTYDALELFKMKRDLIDHHSFGNTTYNFNDLMLNIVISDIEKDLVQGELDVKDIHDRWVSDLDELFDMKHDGQNYNFLDISDWFIGQFGSKIAQNISYLTASQIYDSLSERIMDFDHLIAAGEFETITSWLDKHMFSKAHSRTYSELLANVTSSSRLKTDSLHEKTKLKAS